MTSLLALSLAAALAAAAPAAPTVPLDPADRDPAVAACDDFFAHAVGGWQKRNPIPPDRARYGAFEELIERNLATLRAIAEQTAARRDWPAGSVRQKVGDFYAAAMDERAVEKAGLAPLAPWLARVDGLRSAAELPALLAEAHLRALGGGFTFLVDQDEKNATRYIPILYQGGLGLPDREYYLADDERSRALREGYRAHVARMLELSGWPRSKATAGAETVLALETKLAKASRTRVELRDPEKNYNLMKVAALEGQAPGFAWGAYLGALGVPAGHDVNIGQPGFATGFAAAVASEPVQDWKVYLRWHALRAAAPHLPKRLADEDFAFYGKTLEGVERQEERWKRALGWTDDALGEAIGQLYVEKTFTPAAKERMLELVENLRAALGERIDALPWMGPDTKAEARKKLAAFDVKIGYPEKWRDYSALSISRKGHLENVLAASAFETRRHVAKLGKPIDRTEWLMSPPTVNAYYSPTMNEIVFPAGILQPPFFWPEGDDAANYGAIGVVIGHEMTHGFDDQGSQYDAVGNLRSWWTEADRKAYAARTDKMVKQFEGYRALPDGPINGKLTLGENIADLGGVKIAWAALEKALGKDPNAAPAVEGHTPGQRFFLSYAQIWRNNIRDEALRVRLATDPHSPGRFRVLGPLQNLPEFHAAFACKPDSPMARPPEARPEIW